MKTWYRRVQTQWRRDTDACTRCRKFRRGGNFCAAQKFGARVTAGNCWCHTRYARCIDAVQTLYWRGPNAVGRATDAVETWLHAVGLAGGARVERVRRTFVLRLYHVLSTCSSVCTTSDAVHQRSRRAAPAMTTQMRRRRLICWHIAGQALVSKFGTFFIAINRG